MNNDALWDIAEGVSKLSAAVEALTVQMARTNAALVEQQSVLLQHLDVVDQLLEHIHSKTKGGMHYV